MAEYIEREAAIAIIEEKQKELCPVGMYSRHAVYGPDREKFDAWEEIIEAIEAVHAADVVEVRHGRWRQNDNGTWSCPECLSWIPNEQHYYARFCLHCGVKMEAEQR